MAFDESKDQKLGEVARVSTGEKSSIVVDVVRYGDNGKPKVQVTRTFVNKDGEEGRKKLGRISLEELDDLTYALEKAKEFLDQLG